jgi:hypothetical protein
MKIRVISIVALLIAVVMIANASACYPFGLTPGYWKHWTNEWPVPTTTTFRDIGINYDDTLLNALNYQGYGDTQSIMLRQAAAAYLNAMSSYTNCGNFNADLYYPLTPNQVVYLANWALAHPETMLTIKDRFEGFNQLGG